MVSRSGRTSPQTKGTQMKTKKPAASVENLRAAFALLRDATGLPKALFTSECRRVVAEMRLNAVGSFALVRDARLPENLDGMREPSAEEWVEAAREVALVYVLGGFKAKSPEVDAAFAKMEAVAAKVNALVAAPASA